MPPLLPCNIKSIELYKGSRSSGPSFIKSKIPFLREVTTAKCLAVLSDLAPTHALEAFSCSWVCARAR